MTDLPSIVDHLIHDVSQSPILDPATEREVALRMEQGRRASQQLHEHAHQLTESERSQLQNLIDDGEQARRLLIRSLTRLVVRIATTMRHCRSASWDLHDSIQAGMIGLIAALDHYDTRFGVKVATYASYWIRQAIERAFANYGQTIRLPVYQHERIRAMREHHLEWMQAHGAGTSLCAMIASECPDSATVIQSMLPPQSLYEPRYQEDDDTILLDHIADPRGSVDDLAIRRSLIAEVIRCINAWPDRERTIIILRYGLDGNPPQSLRAIAERLNITREGVRQIAARCIQRLRDRFGISLPDTDDTCS